MSSTEQLEANKKLAREYIEEVFNQHKPDRAAGFTTPDVVWHGGSLGDVAGVEGVVGLLESPTARSARSGLPTTSRRSWSRSELSLRPGPRDA